MVALKVEHFLRDYPEASFSLIVDNTQILLRMLEAGKLDFVLVEGFFDGSRYETTLYRKEEFFGICPPGHRFAGRAISLTELESERILATISDFSTIKSLVADGLGVSFLYAPAVSGELERGELVRFDLAGLPMSGAFSFVCLKDNLFAADWIAWMQ